MFVSRSVLNVFELSLGRPLLFLTTGCHSAPTELEDLLVPSWYCLSSSSSLSSSFSERHFAGLHSQHTCGKLHVSSTGPLHGYAPSVGKLQRMLCSHRLAECHSHLAGALHHAGLAACVSGWQQGSRPDLSSLQSCHDAKLPVTGLCLEAFRSPNAHDRFICCDAMPKTS